MNYRMRLCIMLISSLVVMTLLTSPNIGIKLKAFAADVCDAGSTCSNSGVDSIQRNVCARTSNCENNGDFNIQSNTCTDVAHCTNQGTSSRQSNDCSIAFQCTNSGGGSQRNVCHDINGCTNIGTSSSIQSNVCSVQACSNTGFGSVTQSNICHFGGCTNFSVQFQDNRQSNECNGAAPGCFNDGFRTKVIANAISCSSGNPETTTICP